MALWATALYAGLRRGKLQALSWHDIDVGRSVINVRRSWDGSRGAYSNSCRRWSLRKTPCGSSSRRMRMNVSASG